MTKTVSHTDRIADLKEQRIAAILAQVPTEWGDIPHERRQLVMKRAELSDEVYVIDQQIHAARAQQILDKHADPDDPFDDTELETTLGVLRTQNPAAASAIEAARAQRVKA
jgi:hypothetical protein